MNGPPPATAPMTPDPPQCFLSTHWSLVSRARDAADAGGARALEQLCRSYWYPLYAYARRSGCAEEEAQDVTQEFFALLVGKQLLERADAARGKFRSFLLGTMNHVLADRARSAHRQKRGGYAEHVPLEEAHGESRYQMEPDAALAAERLFDKGWAEVLLGRALARLESECDADGKQGRFAAVKAFLLPGAAADADGLRAAAAVLHSTESAVKSLVHRLRERFRFVFREEVAETMAEEAEVDGEMRHLVMALAAGT